MLNKLNYFGDNTSLHGVKHAFSLSHIPLYKKIFWILVLAASGFSASVILRPILSLYSGDAMSYLLDANYIEFETPFPAVTLCHYADSGQAKKYINKTARPKSLLSFYKDISFWNLKYCSTWCYSCQKNVTCVDDFVDAVSEIRPPCQNVMTDCWFGNEHFPCCERFLPQQSEYGLCFTFNSRFNGNVTMLSRRDEPRLPSLIFTVSEDVAIRVHSPVDLVSVGMDNTFGKAMKLSLGTNIKVLLKAEMTKSDRSVTPMMPHARGCLFPHEHPPFAVYWNLTRYTYSNCMLYCRAMAQFHYCNCTHHLMPRIPELPYCKAEEIICLSENKVVPIDPFATYQCDCPMSCEEVLYKTIHIFNSLLKTKNMTRGEIRLAQLPNSMVRRVAIRSPLGLVVDIGGVAGVFFGASLLSMLEIIYLFFIRR